MGYMFTWPGVPGGPIEFSFPVTNMIVPAWRTLQRPGIKARSPRRGIQHENGNPNALARQDSVYLYNGAGGRQASWHGTVDHKEGFANLPGDEVGWQAGDGAGPGNYNGFAVELSQWAVVHGTAAQWRQARRNAAEMNARVSARINATPPTNRHRDYMNKNCPQYLNGNATWWAEYLSDWWFFYNDEKKRMAGGGGDTPDTTFKAGDTVRVIADAINVRQGWGTHQRIVFGVTKGETATIGKDSDGRYVMPANGYTWINVSVPGRGSGWMATGFGSEMWVEKVASKPDPKPTPKPTYAKVSPVKELLDTNFTFKDKYNTAEGITTINELEFIFVADLIEFKRPTKALQYGHTGSAEVKAPYQEGDRAVAAWLVKGSDGVWYYLLTGGDDEWVRVQYTDTVRVSDAPLLGDDME
jgi:hypothetical protein